MGGEVVAVICPMALLKELWKGNRERWWNLLHPSPKENIILWAWTNWSRYRKQYRTSLTNGDWSHARVDHLETIEQVRAFLQR